MRAAPVTLMATRILVLGGKGYYGLRVTGALQRLDGVEVVVGSRSGGVRIDLQDASTFTALDGFDFVVNAADAVGAPPDAAMEYVLRNGGTFVDLSADPVGVERALDRFSAMKSPKGSLVLGAGVFPGVSTAMAAELCRTSPTLQTLHLGVRLSPLSGAGPGNVGLMMATLESAAAYWERGQRKEGAAVGPAVNLPYLGAGLRPSLRVGLPDAPLLHALAPNADVSTHMALIPGAMRFSFAFLAWMLRLLGPLRALVTVPTRWSMLLLRAYLFRSVGTSVALTVVADLGRPGERSIKALVPDGHLAMALGSAAAVSWLRSHPQAPGVYTAGALTPLDELLTEMKRIGGELAVELDAPSRQLNQ